jgi:thiamine-monophosphate kinase
MSEDNLIAEMCRQLPDKSESVILGIGDDTAVVRPPQGPMLFCSDAAVENTHFKIGWSQPAEIGHKALAACLSDIAAMNGRPLYAVISLALRPHLPEKFHLELYRGIAALAYKYSLQIVGGDLTYSQKEVFIDVSLIGESLSPLAGLTTRSGAQPGDLLMVSGPLGTAAAGLYCFENSLQSEPRYSLLKRAYLTPEPRLDLLPLLAGAPGLVTAMMDVSDGLSSDLHRLARSSKVGFQIFSENLPIHSSVRALCQTYQIDPIKLALHGGEDYQLLLCVNAQAWETICQSQPKLESLLTCIGYATTADLGLTIVKKNNTEEPLQAQGWDPFR